MKKVGKTTPEVQDDRKYLNRELSWLAFNQRVLEEAANPLNPALERLKFLAIFESNLDEFYMVRVSGLIEQFEAGILTTSQDGLSPNDQLQQISLTSEPLRQRAADIFLNELTPLLAKSAIYIRNYEELTPQKQEEMNEYFEQEVYPLCTPLVLYPAVTVPFISNRSLNIVVHFKDENGELRLARVKVPRVISRTIRLTPKRHEYILLEDLILNNLQKLFPGMDIIGGYVFRVVRDADVEIRELEAADLISMIEETIRLRRFGDPVLLQVQTNMPVEIRETLMRILELDEDDVFVIKGVLGMEVFWELSKIDKPTLRFPVHIPYLPEQLSSHESIFETVSQRDVLLHHPYDSFRTVEEFVGSAAKDKKVFGIKQTMYRVGSESPIVESLLDAAESGKQVAAMVELKARFDESNNLVWARALERAGAHVTYGFSEMKTHAKLCLVVRREATGLKSYAHIGTGNYNPATSRLYTDIGLLTSDSEITQDISELFNYLTGFSKQTVYRKLLVAPVNMREGIVERIERETANMKAGKPAHIIWKTNALVDTAIIDALYEASNAGVKIDLIVRGVCCLRPGVKKQSENINVISIVGRFLEHSRVYWFANAGKPDVLFGSADAMRRNLDRRVEVLAPISDKRLQKHLREKILETCLRDGVKSWTLHSNGTYTRTVKDKGHDLDAQTWFMKNPSSNEVLGNRAKRSERTM
jgi:polyphosphate kinase